MGGFVKVFIFTVLMTFSGLATAKAPSYPDLPILEPETMTCAAARAFVEVNGEVLVQVWGIFGDGWLVPVRRNSWCNFDQEAETIYVRTQDNRFCGVGYTGMCRPDDRYSQPGG